MRVPTPLAAFAVNVLFFVAPFASAQEPPLQNFDAYIDQAVTDWQTPGLSVAVVKDGEVVLVEGYGVRRLASEGEDTQPVDIDTLFAIGSTTKAMVAAAVAAGNPATVEVGFLGRFERVE